MQLANLGEAVQIKKISEDAREGVFEIEGLYTGYGITIGNALRRTLLSSLPGAAITMVKVKGVGHEFTTIPNVLEDMVEIGMNLKKIRFRVHSDEPQVLTLRVKGEQAVTAGDIEGNANVEIATPDAHIATLSAKGAELDMEITVERGLGYVPVEARKMDKLPIGVVALDAIFTPVIKVSFTVENMRVGERTDYNRVRLAITTDGTLTPSESLQKSGVILQEHFAKIGQIEVKEAESPSGKEEKKEKKAKKAKK